MSESVHVPPAKAFSASRAILAGLIATVAITISLALFGQNIMKMLGGMLLPDASVAAQYAVGGLVHLAIGLFYGIVYAALFGKVQEWNPALKAAVFGLAITAVALAAMPVMSAVLGGKAANPCNPCAPKAAVNPCNPCAAKQTANPCGGAKGPCSGTGNPCNPCSGGGPYAGAISALNHLIYAFVLAMVYRTRPA